MFTACRVVDFAGLGCVINATFVLLSYFPISIKIMRFVVRDKRVHIWAVFFSKKAFRRVLSFPERLTYSVRAVLMGPGK